MVSLADRIKKIDEENTELNLDGLQKPDLSLLKEKAGMITGAFLREKMSLKKPFRAELERVQNQQPVFSAHYARPLQAPAQRQ